MDSLNERAGNTENSTPTQLSGGYESGSRLPRFGSLILLRITLRTLTQVFHRAAVRLNSHKTLRSVLVTE